MEWTFRRYGAAPVEAVKLANRQTILVIGGSGFIGRHALRALVAHGHAAYATHAPTRTPPPLPGVTWIPSDLGGEGCAADWPRGCDTVMYLAQSRRWRRFPEGAADVFAVNLASLFRAAEHARRTGAARFIYTSTGSVYPTTDRPARESDPPAAPRNFYVASKLAAEVLLQPYQEMLAVITLRLFTPYGAGQDPEMLIPRLVRNVQEGRPIMLHGPDGLRCNPVAAAEVAEALRRCLELNRTVLLNVGGPELLTLREVGAQIGAVVGRPPRFDVRLDQPAPLVAGETASLRATLAWAPSVTFEQGLREWLGGVPVASAG